MDQIMDSFSMQSEDGEPYKCLPPGFRFHPTDEELIHYLRRKILNPNLRIQAIQQVDLKKSEPWELPGKSRMGEKEWYFFALRDRKYPTGMRTNRATEAGYWKGTGKDREVYSARSNACMGMKKTLVFYLGRAPKGEKTNWIMHEYRLEENPASLNTGRSKAYKDSEWVVCRIFYKMPGGKKAVLKHSPKAEYDHMTSIEDPEQLFLHDCPLPALVTDDPEYESPLQEDQLFSFTIENITAALSPLSSMANDNPDHRVAGQRLWSDAHVGLGDLPQQSINLTREHDLIQTSHGLRLIDSCRQPQHHMHPKENEFQHYFDKAGALPLSCSNIDLETEEFENEVTLQDRQNLRDDIITSTLVEGGTDLYSSSQPSSIRLPTESLFLGVSEEESPMTYKSNTQLSSPEEPSRFWDY